MHFSECPFTCIQLFWQKKWFFFSVSNILLLYFFHLPKVPWNLKKKTFFFFFETCHIKRIKKKKEKVVKGKGLSQDKISTYYGSPLTNGYLIFLSFCLFVCLFLIHFRCTGYKAGMILSETLEIRQTQETWHVKIS